MTLALLAASLALSGCMQTRAEQRPVLVQDIASRRVAGERTVYQAGLSPLASVVVDVTVDAKGRVTETLLSDRSTTTKTGAVMQAFEAAREWRFRPLVRYGRAVPMRGSIWIRFLPPERAILDHVPFPDGPLADTSITLERGPCFGTCPVYTVTVDGTGQVRFTGSRFVLASGEHRAQVSPDAVRALVDRFRAADFWSLDSSYRAEITDSPTQTLTVRIGGKTKSVTDYVGTMVGMPRVVTELEEAVDAVSGSARWITGSPETLASLDAEGLDAGSEAGASITAEAIARGQDDLALALLGRGVRLDGYAPPCTGQCGWNQGLEDGTWHSRMIAAAATFGRARVFARVGTPEALSRLGVERLNALLLGAARARSPSIVARLIEAGADPGFGEGVEKADTPMTRALGEAYGRVASDVDVAAVVRLLLAGGASPNAPGSSGARPLQLAADEGPEVVRILLAAGADVNGRSEHGAPLLYLTQDEEVALLALKAGASRDGKNAYEKTLAQIADDYGWTRVAALLTRKP